MFNHFKQLDRLLRGEATSPSALRLGTLLIPVDKVAVAALALAAFYGLCMGIFALANGSDAVVQRMLATFIKVPALFFLTLLITFPSLYIFNAVVGSRLAMADVLRLLVGSLGVMVAVLASFGPIVGFFSVSTTSYPFMLLLNVALFAVAGLLGLRFLMRTLERVTQADQKKEEDWSRRKEREGERSGRDSAGDDNEFGIEVELQEFELALAPTKSEEGALDKEDGAAVNPKVQRVFRIWMVVFGLVGAQMGWVLRPFLGDPNLPFQWLRTRESSFFESVGGTLVDLLIKR